VVEQGEGKSATELSRLCCCYTKKNSLVLIYQLENETQENFFLYNKKISQKWQHEIL